jgi:hypothetical protein
MKALLGAASAKVVRKILSLKGLEVKILMTNGLGRAFLALAAPCATAMIADFECGGKVGCHNVAVEKGTASVTVLGHSDSRFRVDAGGRGAFLVPLSRVQLASRSA